MLARALGWGSGQALGSAAANWDRESARRSVSDRLTDSDPGSASGSASRTPTARGSEKVKASGSGSETVMGSARGLGTTTAPGLGLETTTAASSCLVSA
jgi:hypothetical protein